MRGWLLRITLAGAMATMVTGAPLSTGKWLVDLGRDYPLAPQASLSDFDAEIALLFMQAAARVEPELAEAYRWQVDLLLALGREREAVEALQHYVKRAPEDGPAQLALVVTELEQLQTAEQRRDFCLHRLQQAGLSPEAASELHRTLAVFYWNRGEEAKAPQEAQAAVQIDPNNTAARGLLDELTPGREPAIAQIDQMLLHLKQSPADADVAVHLGDELMLLGLAAEADRWYRHAASVYALVSPDALPTHLLGAQALAMLALDRPEEAESLASQALEGDPLSIEAQIVRALVAAARDDQDATGRHLQQAGQIVLSLLESVDGANWAVSVKDEIAWVGAHYLDLFSDAERLARQVLTTEPEDVVARRVLGTIERRNKRWAEAEQILRPVAKLDTWSAIELARALESAGQKDQAVAELRLAARMPANYEQRRVIISLAEQWKVEVSTTQPAGDDIRNQLQSFPYDVLDYPLHPQRYLSAQLHMPAPDIEPAQPWWCRVRLENVGPFPITFGPAMMVDSELVCPIETRGDRVRASGSLIRIRLNCRFQLAPGQILEIPQTIELGPIRAAMIGTPQMSHEVEVTGITNAIEYRQGDKTVCQPGIGGVRLGPVRFRRRPFVGSSANMQRLLAQSESADTDARIEATLLLAMLLGEHQHLAAGRLTYPAHPIDVNPVRAALVARAGDGDWRVRAQLAEAMRWFVVDGEAMPTAMKLVNDSHWLVRGLARRMLTDQVGKTFEPVLKGSAEADPDPWVRRLSRALLGRLSLASPGGTQKQKQHDTGTRPAAQTTPAQPAAMH